MTSSVKADLTPEEDKRQSSALAKINMWCKLSEAMAEDLTEQYEKETFEERLVKSKRLLAELTDSFYASAGRHFIINALCKVGRQSEAIALFKEITEDFIREKVLEENPTLANDPTITTLLNLKRLQKSVDDIRNEVRELAAREPPEASSIDEGLAFLGTELGKQLATINVRLQAHTRNLNFIFWLVVIVLLIVLFR